MTILIKLKDNYIGNVISIDNIVITKQGIINPFTDDKLNILLKTFPLELIINKDNDEVQPVITKNNIETELVIANNETQPVKMSDDELKLKKEQIEVKKKKYKKKLTDEKKIIDIETLSDNIKNRIIDFADDLSDDGKRNYSNKK